MPQAGWADPLVAERRTRAACGVDMLAEHVREAGSGHGLAAGVQKQRGVGCESANREPFAQDRPGLFPEWKPPFASPLPLDADAGAWIEAHILDPESHEFRHAQAAGDADMQHRAITDAH